GPPSSSTSRSTSPTPPSGYATTSSGSVVGTSRHGGSGAASALASPAVPPVPDVPPVPALPPGLADPPAPTLRARPSDRPLLEPHATPRPATTAAIESKRTSLVTRESYRRERPSSVRRAFVLTRASVTSR